jgi:hypothetical protein
MWPLLPPLDQVCRDGRHDSLAAAAVQVATALDRNQGLHDYYVFDQSCRCRSAVASGFLNKLYAGGQSEFGIDVSEVGLHGPR